MDSWPAMLSGFVAVLILIAALGWWSGRKVTTEEDFAAGSGKAGTLIVAGTIMGTLVSGQATLGTAQLAFSFGISALWFTLGSGFGCLVLALLYVTRMRATHKTTLVSVIVEEYGTAIDYATSIFSTIGIFISMVAQMIAASALITALTPIPLLTATLLSAVLMACYVIFGGVWGTGIAGIAKLILLYAACIVGGSVALWLGNGPGGIFDSISTLFCSTDVGTLHSITDLGAVEATFLSMVARGPLHDLGSALALVLGVISTQSYASAVWSAKSNTCAKRGTLPMRQQLLLPLVKRYPMACLSSKTPHKSFRNLSSITYHLYSRVWRSARFLSQLSAAELALPSVRRPSLSKTYWGASPPTSNGQKSNLPSSVSYLRCFFLSQRSVL